LAKKGKEICLFLNAFGPRLIRKVYGVGALHIDSVSNPKKAKQLAFLTDLILTRQIEFRSALQMFEKDSSGDASIETKS